MNILKSAIVIGLLGSLPATLQADSRTVDGLAGVTTYRPFDGSVRDISGWTLKNMTITVERGFLRVSKVPGGQPQGSVLADNVHVTLKAPTSGSNLPVAFEAQWGHDIVIRNSSATNFLMGTFEGGVFSPEYNGDTVSNEESVTNFWVDGFKADNTTNGCFDMKAGQRIDPATLVEPVAFEAALVQTGDMYKALATQPGKVVGSVLTEGATGLSCTNANFAIRAWGQTFFTTLYASNMSQYGNGGVIQGGAPNSVTYGHRLVLGPQDKVSVLVGVMKGGVIVIDELYAVPGFDWSKIKSAVYYNASTAANTKVIIGGVNLSQFNGDQVKMIVALKAVAKPWPISTAPSPPAKTATQVFSASVLKDASGDGLITIGSAAKTLGVAQGTILLKKSETACANPKGAVGYCYMAK